MTRRQVNSASEARPVQLDQALGMGNSAASRRKPSAVGKTRDLMTLIRQRPIARILACALLAVVSGRAAAQSPAPAQPAPQQTTATYEDWIVRCETRQGPPSHKNCEMVQFTQVKGQSGVLTQIAIGQPVKGQAIKLVIQVPISVWLPTGVKLLNGGKDTAIVANYRWCIPTACMAFVEIKDDTIRKFKAATAPGKLEFKDANQKDIALPVSFRGFSAAYDALSKE
jgi:invasion protein IalB